MAASHDTFILTKLLSEITRAKGANHSHFYCRLRTWKDRATPDSGDGGSTYAREYHDMLYFRGLLLLFETHPSKEHVGSATAFELLGACKSLIDIIYNWTINDRPACWTSGSFAFAAGIIHLDIALRDRYARSQQLLADIMDTSSKCSSALASYSRRFSALKRHCELYRALAAVALQYFERERVVSLSYTVPALSLPSINTDYSSRSILRSNPTSRSC